VTVVSTERPGAVGARILPLDGLRALAFGMVFLQHAVGVPLSWSGVDMFFVLSGYLITGILIRTQGKAGYLRSFYRRRTLRIFPAYYASILLACVLLPSAAAAAPWAVVYLGNVHRALYGDGFPLTPLWSLAVEEQFYLLWPLALKLCPPRFRWRLLIALLVLAPVVRALLTVGLNEHAAQSLLFGRMDVLAAGAALALAEFTWGRAIFRTKRRAIGLAAVVAGVLFAGIAASSSHGSLSYSVGVLECDLVLYALLVAFVLGSVDETVGKWLSLRPLVYVGQISYGLYLLHVPVLFVVRAHVHGFVAVAVAALATLVIASLSWFWFERPVMRWGARRALEPSAELAAAV
jgi:peptidoglycan/LPS O-acetylase OafA/YrhL